MSVRPDNPARALIAGSGIGLLVALTTVMALTLVRPTLLVFALGGLAMLIPAMVLKNPKSYGLFLLVLSIPFDIQKRLSSWWVDPQALVDRYGLPPGVTSLSLYMTDVALIALLLPWLARLCLRRERLFFPRIGYLFVFYLAWALIVSVANARSFYFAIFELFRQTLHFLYFVYLINNVETGSQFRTVVIAVFLGLIVSAGSVITFFELGISAETGAFSGLYKQAPEITTESGVVSQGSQIKRSAGMFSHPALAACLFGLTIPIVLAYLMAARRNRDRILFLTLLAWGLLALLLTFSRAGLLGLMVGNVLVVALGGWSGLISRRAFTITVFSFATAAALSAPLVTTYLTTRPKSFYGRFQEYENALQAIREQDPILGVGLNNSTAVMKSGQKKEKVKGRLMPAGGAPSPYLAVLLEEGPLGFLLFFVFFGKIVTIALRTMREAPIEMKPLLVGIVGGLASLATQNIADQTIGTHPIASMLWLFAALIVAIARRVQAEGNLDPAAGHAEPVAPDLRRVRSVAPA